MLASPARCAAQQSVTSTPQTIYRDSFYERFGTSFGYQGRSFFFNNIGLAPLPFAGGGFGAGGGSSFGFRAGGFSFGLSALQGSDRSIVSQTPSLTVTNGAGGVFSSGVLRPFVTGWTPVVGDAQWINPVDLALARMRQQQAAYPAAGASPPARAVPGPRGAGEQAPQGYRSTGDDVAEARGDDAIQAGTLSLAELRRRAAAKQRQHDQESEQEAQRWLKLAEKAEREGKLAVARDFARRAEAARAKQ